MEKKIKLLGYIEGIVSILINIGLFIIKFTAGIMANSVALIADAWHTLSDSITSIVVVAGFKFASKPADEEHPFGHGRIELIGAIIIGILLCVVGFNFFAESLIRLKNKEIKVTYNTFAIIATIISVVVKEALAQFALIIGKKVDSKSIIADGWHHRSDAISSIIILIGIFFGKHFWWIDGVLGILVALFIFYTAFDILKGAINPLIGEIPDPDLIEKIRSIIKTIIKKDVHLHHIHFHRYGYHKEITFHIKLPADMSLFEAHELANKVEKTIESELKIFATIHMEPIK